MHDTIHIAGPGALGLFFAGVLSRAGAVATLISRPGSADSTVAPRVVSSSGEVLFAPAAALRLRPVDSLPANAWRGSVALVAVKARDVLPLLAQLEASFAATGSVPDAMLVLSNGLGIATALREWKQSQPRASRLAIARGTAWFGCRRESFEQVRFAGPARLDFAWLDADRDPRLEGILQGALSGLGIEVVREDFAGRLEWRKGAWNASMNALLALADAPNGALLEEGPLREEFESLLEESFAVARAEGVELGAEDRERIWEGVRRTRTNWNSFHGDLRGGRPTELPFLNQWLLARALALRVSVPGHERIVTAVTQFEREGKKTAGESESS